MNVGIILYGPPASGKDTVTRALAAADPAIALFARIKVGQGRSAGYRMSTPAQLADLRAAGAVVYENSRYGATYVTDRPGLDSTFAAGKVPVMHLGQITGVQAVLSSYPARWLTVMLWCPREVTASRSASRGDADTSARLAAWEATQADVHQHPEFRFDLVVRTDSVRPEAAAEQIRQALATHRAGLVMVDFDDTLIDRRQAVVAWIASYAAERGLSPSAARQMLDAMQLRVDLETFEALQESLELPDPAVVLWNRYSIELPKAVQAAPEVLEALARLRATARVVVVTNGGSEIQRAKLTSSGVAAHVDAVVISEEAGARKPDQRIFEVAAAAVGRTLASGGWMIGDNAELDVAGGQAAGLRTIWISHGRPWPGGMLPDFIAETALDALAHLHGSTQ